MKPWDYKQQLNFTHRMAEVVEANDNYILLILLIFISNSMMTQQNYPHLALENLGELQERQLYRPKVMVWFAVGKAAIIGP